MTQTRPGEKHQNAFDNQRRADAIAKIAQPGLTRAARIRVVGGRATTSGTASWADLVVGGSDRFGLGRASLPQPDAEQGHRADDQELLLETCRCGHARQVLVPIAALPLPRLRIDLPQPVSGARLGPPGGIRREARSRLTSFSASMAQKATVEATSTMASSARVRGWRSRAVWAGGQ